MKKIFIACITAVLVLMLATACFAQYAGGYMTYQGNAGTLYYGSPGYQGYTPAPGYVPAPAVPYVNPYPQGGYDYPQPYYPYQNGDYHRHHHGGGC